MKNRDLKIFFIFLFVVNFDFAEITAAPLKPSGTLKRKPLELSPSANTSKTSAKASAIKTSAKASAETSAKASAKNSAKL